MALKLAPVLDYIFVRKTEEALPSGLYMAAPADPTAPRYAEVVATGPGRPSEYSGEPIRFPTGMANMNADGSSSPWTLASPVKIGDTILMHGGAGTKIKVDGDELWAILPRDLIGVVQEK
jgi:co-chaperonin GroES (HSP10)